MHTGWNLPDVSTGPDSHSSTRQLCRCYPRLLSQLEQLLSLRGIQLDHPVEVFTGRYKRGQFRVLFEQRRWVFDSDSKFKIRDCWYDSDAGRSKQLDQIVIHIGVASRFA